ncbi:hypothetical protein AB0G02_13145 [Actinosynnema sp. NPDC023658]|uniref:hypothetical protein n=1 Tax=Actinosynnema sp. NPDC023658 TaxID=3155465 RepID=UPI00340EC461
MADRSVVGAGTGWSRLFSPIAVFLGLFGVLNFVELPLGWKDRQQQVGRYLDATLDLGPDWVLPVIWVVKVVELGLGVLALAALLRRRTRWLAAAVVGWLAWFTAFSAMDVWAADRAELQEHTVYFVMFAVLLGMIHLVTAVEGYLGSRR